MYYNGANSYLFVNGVEIQKFHTKYSDINVAPLFLENLWKEFLVYNMKKTGWYEHVYDFSVDYKAAAVDEILDIQYLMKKNNIWVKL